MGNKSSTPEDDSFGTEETPSTQENRVQASQAQQMSYYQMMKAGYQQLVHAIIRPPRCEYDPATTLGPTEFSYCNRRFKRKDFVIKNSRGLKIQCCMWEPIESDRPNALLPCVIYMHGNSSGRPESLTVISLVLSLGATLCSFDFCGSGLSDGEYVSLGVYEKDDLHAVIEHLRNEGTTSTVALWGRSMGAATALSHGERDPSIAGMILDSAYSDLTLLAEEMVEKGRQNGMFAPGILVKMVLSFIRSSILKTANFDVKDVSPIKYADRSYIPALFVAARGDEFVQPHHSQTIHDKYAGDKNLIYVEGDHNSNRPLFMFTSVGIFLTNTLQLPEAWSLSSDAEKYVSLGLKPWDYVGEGVGNRSNISGLRAMLMGLDDYGQQIDAHNDDAALERVLALSLLEQQGSSKHNTSNQVKGRVGTNNNVLKKAPDTSADITGNINGGVEIGMTADRQEDIQKAIYNMFNGTASGTGAGLQTTATPEPPKAIPPKNDTTSNLKSCNIALEVLARENVEKAVPAEGKANGAIQKSTSSSRRLPDNIAGFELINDTDAQVGAGAEEVTGISNENIDGISCCHCTLINAPTLKFCLACNNPLSLMPLKES